MSSSAEGMPERLGRLLGRAVVQGRVAARQVADPATREQLTKAGRIVAARAQPTVQQAASRIREELAARGPDVAEQAAQRAVDRVLWGLGAHSSLLAAALRPLAQPVRNTAGAVARDLTKAAGGGEGPAATSTTDSPPPPLPPAQDEGQGEGTAGSGDPPA